MGWFFEFFKVSFIKESTSSPYVSLLIDSTSGSIASPAEYTSKDMLLCLCPMSLLMWFVGIPRFSICVANVFLKV